MAIKYAVRWRPAAYRSTIEAILVPTGDDGSHPGYRLQTLQAIVYDDTKVGLAGNPYKPGAPETEQHLAIVDEVAIQLDVTAFAGKTHAQALAMWNAARDAQIAVWQADPYIDAKVKAAAGGALSGFVVLG